MDTAIAVSASSIAPSAYAGVLRLVLDGCHTKHTRRKRETALRDFLIWYRAHSEDILGSHPERSEANTTFSRRLVLSYLAYLRDELRLAPSNINARLTAIRMLAREAAQNDLLDEKVAHGIVAIKGIEQHGQRTGNWLTKEQAEALLAAPDIAITKGLRDRALLAALLGCGLRRSEVSALTFGHIQQRDGRWAIVDLIGKHRRIRSIPMPSWTMVCVDAWAEHARLRDDISGHVFRPLRRGTGRLYGTRLSEQAIFDVVKEYVEALGLPPGIAPHDLRRTWAKLAHKGGAALEQIQLSLGHASIQTTERYIGVEQDFTDAPCDHLGLRIG